MTREKSDHFDGQRFMNPFGPAPQPFTAVPRLMTEPRRPWPRQVEIKARQVPQRDEADAVVNVVGDHVDRDKVVLTEGFCGNVQSAAAGAAESCLGEWHKAEQPPGLQPSSAASPVALLRGGS